MLGNLCRQLHTVALVAVIAFKLVGILLEHHIRIFLVEKWETENVSSGSSFLGREAFGMAEELTLVNFGESLLLKATSYILLPITKLSWVKEENW